MMNTRATGPTAIRRSRFCRWRPWSRKSAALPFEQIDIPALFIYHPDDQVVDQSATAEVAKRWGGPAEVLVIAASDDPSNHVIAGDIISPSNNDAVASAIAAFVRGL
jgi:pimeloyl-ACP methyl ester carboxylesterase